MMRRALGFGLLVVLGSAGSAVAKRPVTGAAPARASEKSGPALAAFKNADYESALKQYEELAKSSPTPDTLIQIARCLDRLLRSNDAVVAYQRFLHGNAGASESKEARDRVSFLRKHLAQDANPETIAREAIERGSAFFKYDLYSEARGEFETATAALPDKPNAYRWLGLTLERQSDCKGAISNYDVFLSLVATDDARVAEVNESRHRCSAKLAAEAASAAPATPVARPAGDEPLPAGASDREEKVKQYVDRGVDLYTAGRFKEAREEFVIARTLAPEKATPFRWLGLVDARLDRCAEATTNIGVFLEKVAPSDPRVPEAKEVLAGCRQKLAPKVARAPESRPVTADDPETRARLLLERGAELYQQGHYMEAREDFDVARGILPDRANAYRWLGLADARLGHCKEALGSFDTFLLRVPPSDERVPEVERERDRCRRDGVAPATSSPPNGLAPIAPTPGPTVTAPPPSATSPGTPVAVTPAPHRTPRYVLPLTIGIVAAALIGTGAGLTAAGLNDYNNLSATCAPHCTASQANSVSTLLYPGYALLGVGGAAAVTDAVLWYFWWRNHWREQPRVMLTPTTNGAQVFGHF